MFYETQLNWVRAALRFFGIERTSKVDPGDSLSPIQLRPTFLQPEELELYRRLSAAVANVAIVCPKTRAIDVMQISEASAHLDLAVRLNLRSISFLLCDAKDGQSICVIQTENVQTKHDRSKDAFLTAAFRSSGLPMIRISYTDLPTVKSLKSILRPIFRDQSRRQIAIADAAHPGPPAPAMSIDAAHRHSV